MESMDRDAAGQLTGAALAPNKLDKCLVHTVKKQTEVETRHPADDSFPLLELPAEMRNRIYKYCSEDLDDSNYAPDIVRRAYKPWAQRKWKFIGLTQTCKQIRAEHRPIWVSTLSILFTLDDLTDFINTFLSEPDPSMYAPGRVQIVWDHGLHDNPGDKYNLTRLCQLQARCPAMRITFLPSKLVGNETRRDAMCWYCFGEWDAEKHGNYDYDNPVEACTCAPPGMDPGGWEQYQYDLISRTNTLLALICHTNTAWLWCLRNNMLDIECVFRKSADPVEFRIKCKARFCETELNGDSFVHAEKAWALLRTWGIFELPVLDKMSFIIAFFTRVKIRNDGHEMLSSELREVHVTKVKGTAS